MNVYLTPEELLHVLQAVQLTPLSDGEVQTSLLYKLKRPLIEALEKEEERVKGRAYLDWSHREEQKIDLLKKSLDNLGIKSKKPRRK